MSQKIITQNHLTLNHEIRWYSNQFYFKIKLARGLISFQREWARFLRNSQFKVIKNIFGTILKGFFCWWNKAPLCFQEEEILAKWCKDFSGLYYNRERERDFEKNVWLKTTGNLDFVEHSNFIRGSTEAEPYSKRARLKHLTLLW